MQCPRIFSLTVKKKLLKYGEKVFFEYSMFLVDPGRIE